MNSIRRNFQQVVVEGHQTLKTSSFALDGVRVLIVEDEDDIASLLTFILEDAGAEVLTVVYASRALALLEQYQPDLLLCNIKLPDEDGLSLIRKVRTRSAQQANEALPAIAVSSYAREVNSANVLAAGFQKYILKSTIADELVSAVAQITKR
ncbi:MAG TPA: response regulator [Cyanobacteria bacterium UBA11049]|nr:response regulator [Cyanobacteria bacterium UBA11049]